MPKGNPPANGQSFAKHFYGSQSCEEKNKQKSRHMAQMYRKGRKFVNCVLSIEEYATLKKQAESAGCSPTAYLRKAAFASLERKPLIPKFIEVRISELVHLLRNMATNLNQIARRTNQTTKLGLFDAFQARKTVLGLEIAFKVFMDNLFRK